MRLTMNVREAGNVTIVDLNGRLVFGEETGGLRETVATILRTGKKNILLNLADISFIDSTGVGQLVACYVTAENSGASLRLVNRQKHVPDVLRLTRVDTVIPHYADEKAAVASFPSETAFPHKEPATEGFPQVEGF